MPRFSRAIALAAITSASEDYEKVKKDIQRREELGKKLMGEGKKTD